ncbi:hypothetical protein ACHAO8_002399 [Botrytis cinerea]
MVRPSQIARRARREHKRQQGILQDRGGAQGARQSSRDCGNNKQTLLDTHVVGYGQSTIGSLVAPKPIHGMQIGSLRRKTKRDLKNKLFKGVVVIEPRETALASAAKEALLTTPPRAERKPSKIVIYSDCPGALRLFDQFRNSLRRLDKLPNAEQLIVPGIIASEALSVLEVEVELRYIPAHSGVEGNVRAD